MRKVIFLFFLFTSNILFAQDYFVYVAAESDDVVSLIKFDGKKAFNVSSLEFNKTGNSSDIDFAILSANALMDGKSIQVLLNQNIDKTLNC